MSCKSIYTKSGAETSVKDVASKAPVTEMQKLMAEKAYKMPDENNPIMAHKYGADPAVLVYNDTLYVYTTNDMQQLEFTKGKADNSYNKITTLNVFSSKDMVNWTDCGEIPVAGKNNSSAPARWAGNSWAPAVAYKRIDGKDKFFIYFADSANGIGVLSSDSPLGPFIDPIKKPLISRSTPTCAKINWLFDPAVMVDDDGNGYLYFGGGHDADKYEHPMNARCAALSDDMISIKGEPRVIDAPFLFEDSGIHKMGDTYYYTYCTNWADRKNSKDKDKMPAAVIAYMTSKNPLGPFEYRGYTLENPGKYFGVYGNNHHWFFKFHDKWYIAYHTQTLEKMVGCEKGGYRNTFINEIAVNADGTLPIQKVTKKGVLQACLFNPYVTVPASTFASSRNVAITKNQTAVAVKDGAYLCIKGADLNKGGTKLILDCNAGNKADFKIKIDGAGGNGTTIYENGKLMINDEQKGKHDLYLIMPEGFELVSWKFE